MSLTTASWRPSIGRLARIHQALGDVAKLDIEVLGGPAQDIEGLVSGDALSFHENAFGLADQFAADQSSLEVDGSMLLLIVDLGRRKGDAGQDGQDQSFASVHDAERVRITGIEIQGTASTVGRQRERQYAPDPPRAGLRSEVRPSGVVD
jgi:hypothetical protein